MANSEHVTREIVPLRTSTTPKKPHILLAASGSVAAIKFGHLCRCFSEWAEVKAVATKTALRFIDRNSIPYNIVLYTDENEWSTWRKLGDTVLHIELCSWADMMVIAPLSANTLGKIAGGLCDNLLTCVVRAWDKSKPLFVAPAMNPLMWNNPFTEKQLVLMEDELPIQLIRPENGAMAEPSVIDSVRLFLQKRTAKDGVDVKEADCSSTCTKLPASISHALIHYSTSSITPQQTIKEISVTAKVLEKKSPCNFLVFGLGHDSLMWSALNYGGRTIFLEEDEAWIEQIKHRFPMLESYHVTYDSKVNQADILMEEGRGPECTEVGDVRHSMCHLALKGLPSLVYETKWDLIMVDAPTGYYDEAPGRMTAIYTAGMIARGREAGGETDVFVHDVNREVEDRFSKAFLCEGYMKKQEGRLRHFTIPSYGDGSTRPLCP
ncbi:hypothetical protein Ancab_015896 [Ancistrocladus abbreviatus]